MLPLLYLNLSKMPLFQFFINYVLIFLFLMLNLFKTNYVLNNFAIFHNNNIILTMSATKIKYIKKHKCVNYQIYQPALKKSYFY